MDDEEILATGAFKYVQCSTVHCSPTILTRKPETKTSKEVLKINEKLSILEF